MSEIRKSANRLGKGLLLYQAFTFSVIAVCLIVMDSNGQTPMENFRDIACALYLFCITVSLFALIFWKKPAHIFGILRQRGSTMTFTGFCCWMAMVMGIQLIGQLFSVMMQWFLEIFGISYWQITSAMSMDAGKLSVFVYVFIAAPIWEELLFRGLILQALAPFVRKFALIASAVVFALFHSNPVQIPYALVLGLLLGWVCLKHSFAWAVLLHGISNFFYGFLLPYLLAGFPSGLANWLYWAVIVSFFLIGLCLFGRKLTDRSDQCLENPQRKGALRGFFTAPAVLLYCISCLLQMVIFFMSAMKTICQYP